MVALIVVMLAEAGTATVILNASPHAPLGFWLWFGGIAVLIPIVGYWVYRNRTASKA